ELESEKVSGRHELRLASQLEHLLEVASGGARAGRDRIGCRLRLRVLPAMSGDPFALGRAPILVAQGHAVDANRTADEDAFLDEPRVFAIEAEQADLPGTEKICRLALVEDVLLQLFPVFVTLRQDASHEAVEIGFAV